MKNVCSGEFRDKWGDCIKLLWNEDKWLYHLRKHSELQTPENLAKLIEAAILDPSIVMEGVEQKGMPDEEKKRHYYKEHSRDRSYIFYTKVTIGRKSSSWYVKSVFQQNALHYLVVQENRYPQIYKQIWKNEKSYIS